MVYQTFILVFKQSFCLSNFNLTKFNQNLVTFYFNQVLVNQNLAIF
jgi:hypothetical protein